MSSITKLIFAGLDKAGKTTIHRKTMEEMSVQDIENMSPTKGIERNVNQFLDHDFSVWDLGGQLGYRETYLSKPEIFNQTKALIFVIDIQDIERIDEAYQYFTDILQILKNVDPAPKLYVLFHKYDPEIAGRLKSHFYRAARLFRKADKLTPQKFKFYLTSIYSNSIDLAVKRILFENFDNFEEPTQKLQLHQQDSKKEGGVVPLPQTGSKAPPTIPKTKNTITSKPTSNVASSSNIPTSTQVGAPVPTNSSVPAPTRSGVPTIPTTPPIKKTAPPLTKEPKKSHSEAMEKKEFSEKEALEDATPKSLMDLSDSMLEKLTHTVEKRMKESDEIAALSILSIDSEQILAVGKSDIDIERLATLKEVAASLNPRQFYKKLSDIEYRGLGHFSLSDFDIYFARASDEYAIAIIATDVSTRMLQNAQRIVNSIRQAMGVVTDSEGAGLNTDEKPKVKKKKDLVSDLRSRLKALSGLSDLD